MTEKTVYEQVQEDLAFDLETADDKLMRVASLRVKYSNSLMRARGQYNALERKEKRIWGELYEYYLVDYNVKLDRRDIPIFIKRDTKYQENKEKMDKLDEKMEFIDSILKSLDSLNYSIPAAIKWAIFQRGG